MAYERGWTLTATITRPANTTQYTDGDGVSTATTGTILTFAGVAKRAGGGGKITGATLHKTDQDLTTAAFTLYLFDTTVAGAGFDDNAAIAITDAEFQTCLGSIRFLAAEGENVVTGDFWPNPDDFLCIPYQCAASDNSLYGVLVARGAYTPASGEVFTIHLSGEVC